MRRRECGSRRDSRCESEHGNLPGNASRPCVEISPILDNQVKVWSDYYYLELLKVLVENLMAHGHAPERRYRFAIELVKSSREEIDHVFGAG